MFEAIWEYEFFVVQNMNDEVQCLICEHIICRSVQYFLLRHYVGHHNNFELLSADERKLKFYELKAKYFLKYIFDKDDNTNTIDDNDNINKQIENNLDQENSKFKKASFAVALALAKKCRPFDDGIFFKDLSQIVLGYFGEQRKQMQQNIAKIPLSRRTIARRTEIISKYLYSCTKIRLFNCKFFSLCLDESTDINNLSQLIICVKSVNDLLDTNEEILSVVSMHGHVTGEILYNIIDKNVFSIFGKSKCSAICTDGARVMTGKNQGLIGWLIKNNIEIPSFHCIIHQQSLFSKELNMSHTMEIAVKIINKIKGGHHALRHRKFKEFLAELESDFGDVLLYTEVRWLSRGRSLQRVFDLRQEIKIFFEKNSFPESSEIVSNLSNTDFLLDLAFLCDLTCILNQLNLSLQGKNKHIFELVPIIKHFDRKLQILIEQLKNNNTSNLEKTKAHENSQKLQYFSKIVENLLNNYKTRFQDFNIIKSQIDLHNYPFICEINEQPSHIHEELIILRTDISLPLEMGTSFWKHVKEEKYPKIKTEIFKLYAMFGSSYDCEVSFSTMKIIQTKFRNTLSDQHIQDLIRIKSYDSEINIEDIMEFEKNMTLH